MYVIGKNKSKEVKNNLGYCLCDREVLKDLEGNMIGQKDDYCESVGNILILNWVVGPWVFILYFKLKIYICIYVVYNF